MWLFGGKDWNIVGIMFEKSDLYTINANRVKGKNAEAVKTKVKAHERTILCVVYDQKGAILDSLHGRGVNNIPAEVVRELEKVLHTNHSIREVLKMLEEGKTNRAAQKMIWAGYPKKTSSE